MKLPNLIIGGAPKCGTSSLYFWLAKHPEVFASKTKETFFFSDKKNRFNKYCNCIDHSINDYSKFFQQAKNEKIRFEATAAYLYSKNALSNFLKFKHSPKIIFILREPSAQIYSHYKMEKYRTKKTNLNFEEYVKLKKIDNYVQYAKHLKRWLSKYPNHLIKVLIFEDFIKHKQERMIEISKFLKIQEDFYNDFDFQHRNESVAIRWSFFHHISLAIQPIIPHKIQELLLPLYMKINSRGKVKENEEDRFLLEKLKLKYLPIRKDILKLYPELPLAYWE